MGARRRYAPPISYPGAPRLPRLYAPAQGVIKKNSRSAQLRIIDGDFEAHRIINSRSSSRAMPVVSSLLPRHRLV